MWTNDFNEKFSQRFGFSPELLYPALWYNIGPDTPSARNSLFGFRAQLYAEGFMKTIQEWASAHGIKSTGHQDQEEVVNPVGISGDLMLCGKYMDIPGIDKIGGDRPAERFYKVISSSAYNWDKPYVMSETYGAMGNISVEEMYAIAMEQYAKGINQLIPHAVLYDDSAVTFLPELSYRNSLYREAFPTFNMFLSRLNYLLAKPNDRHVADIAMIYPIEAMQAEHNMDGKNGFYDGGVVIPNMDYVNLSTLLTDSLGRDFTYLHPEVINEKCTVEEGQLVLNNKINREQFRVLIVPGMKTISLANLKKVEKFYRKGGCVVFTTQLPEQSVEFGRSAEIRKIVARMLNASKQSKGKVLFVDNPSLQSLEQALGRCNFVADVNFVNRQPLNYIHKVSTNGQSVYYFANLGKTDCQSQLIVKGKMTPVAFNPHTGERNALAHTHQWDRGVETTKFTLSLKSKHSVFVVSEE